MSRYCTKCGVALSEEVKFCSRCGAEVRTYISGQLSECENRNKSIKQRKSKALLLAKIIAVVIVFFLVNMGWILVFYFNDSTFSFSKIAEKEKNNTSDNVQAISDFCNEIPGVWVLWSSIFVTLRPNFCYRGYATP